MKKQLMALLAIVALPTASTLAQPPERPERPDRPERPERPDGPFFRPGPQEAPARPGPAEFERANRERIEQMVERMVQALGLSGEQAEQFRRVLRESEERRNQMRQEMAERMRGIEEEQRKRLNDMLSPEQMGQLERFLRQAGRAMGGDEPPRTERPERPGQAQPNRPSPEQFMNELGLSDEQRRRVQGALRGFEEARRELQRYAQDPNIPREQVEQQMQRIQRAIDAQMREILSPEQFERYQQMRESMGSGGFFAERQRPETAPNPNPARPPQQRQLGGMDNLLERLNLEGETRDNMRKLLDETRQRIQDAMESTPREQLRERVQAIQEQMLERAREILSAEQFERLRESMRGGQRQRQGQPNRPQRPDGPGNEPRMEEY